MRIHFSKVFTLKAVFVAALAFTIALMQVQAYAQEGSFTGKEYEIGLEGGWWFPGTIDIEDANVDKSGGLLIRVFADMFVAPKFLVGGYLNYSTATVEYAGYEADADFYELGIAFKPRFLLSPTMALKPGLNIGYRQSKRDRLDVEPPDVETDADGLAVNVSVELQFKLTGGYVFFIDGGFLTQPSGGNDDADVTWGPIMYLCAGIVL
jgi:hypothetical protein